MCDCSPIGANGELGQYMSQYVEGVTPVKDLLPGEDPDCYRPMTCLTLRMCPGSSLVPGLWALGAWGRSYWSSRLVLGRGKWESEGSSCGWDLPSWVETHAKFLY